MAAMRCFLPLLLAGVLGLPLSSASVNSTTVGFVMVQHVSFGQVFKVVGNTSALGNWNISEGVNMTWNAGDIWTASVALSAGSTVAFKAVVLDYSTGKCNCWMPDPNRTLVVSDDTSSVQFVAVQWDVNTCASTCSNTNACSLSNVGTCSTTQHKEKEGSAIFSIL